VRFQEIPKTYTMKNITLTTTMLGCVTLSWAQPANDDCSNAAILSVGAGCSYTTGDVSAGTASGYAVPCGGTANDDVFYTFYSGANTSVTVTVDGSANFDAVVQLTTGCPGTTVACADNTVADGIETLPLSRFVSRPVQVPAMTAPAALPPSRWAP
jgi:hypothetical protein